MAGQWRWRPGGLDRPRCEGLDFTAAEAGLKLAGIAMTPDLWSEVRLIAEGARRALNGE